MRCLCNRLDNFASFVRCVLHSVFSFTSSSAATSWRKLHIYKLSFFLLYILFILILCLALALSRIVLSLSSSLCVMLMKSIEHMLGCACDAHKSEVLSQVNCTCPAHTHTHTLRNSYLHFHVPFDENNTKDLGNERDIWVPNCVGSST